MTQTSYATSEVLYLLTYLLTYLLAGDSIQGLWIVKAPPLKDQCLLRGLAGEKRKQACPRDNKGRIEKVGHRKGDWSFDHSTNAECPFPVGLMHCRSGLTYCR